MSISYFALLFPVAVMFLLYRTQHGLNMRSIGEDPGTADATGLSVNGWRIFYVSVGGAFAGLGGAVLTLGIVGTWLPNVTSGQGWIALAVVIFASWRPLPLIAGALLFGGLGTFGNVAQVEGWSITPEFFSALPYIGTLAMVYLLALLRIQRGGGRAVAGGAGHCPSSAGPISDDVAGRLPGKVALITGAARGQGAAEAELFCREGARVVLATSLTTSERSTPRRCARRAMRRSTAISTSRTGPSGTPWSPVPNPSSGRSTCWSTTPGIVNFGGVVECTDEEWNRAVAVNQTGVFFGMRAAAARMRGTGAGAIVNASSIFGVIGVRGYFAYQASKAAIVQMTRAAAVDLAPDGIRVNCVLPGLIFTEMTETEPEDAVAENIEMTPLGRGGEAREVATGVLFLASDEASFVTGAVLPIDGGYTAQ